jgi:Flp pilus assembly protein TadD
MAPGFVGERRLSDEEIDVIKRWAETGGPEGRSSDLPASPSGTDGWQLGQPDLVVRSPRAYQLRPGDDDVFRNLVVPVNLPATRYVRAVEFRTGGAPVHHAVIHIDRTAASRRLDGADGQPGFDGMGARDAQDPDGHFLGWAPGRGPLAAPAGMPWILERGTDLVVELHLLPGERSIEVQPTIGLFFADAAPVRRPTFMRLGSKAIEIPPGARDHAIEDTLVLPVDVELLSVYPHAHYLGKEMTVAARLPNGATTPLLHIKRWTFRWQQDYRYVTPVALPRGTTLAMRFTYDNSAANEDNPHHPPRPVTGGQRSTDEMANLGVQVVTRSNQDRLALGRAIAAHEIAANVAGAEWLVRHNPEHAANRTFLGASYADAGRVEEAIAHLTHAVRLDPGSANAENELASALLKQNRRTEALVHFRRASALAPTDERFHFNLAKVLAEDGQRAEAATEFAKALSLNPDYSEAHNELGVLLFASSRTDEALPHLRRAVELAPDSEINQSDLGGALAQIGRFDEAREHLQRALALDPDYAPARQNLSLLDRRRRQ